MHQQAALAALSALAQQHRLALFRLLVRAGPTGLSAGTLAERLGIVPSALSFHAARLERAGLVRSWRVGRNICYGPELDGMRRLLAFLSEDCCQGRPELCGALAQLAVAGKKRA
ncbi:MAG: ArsR/SmtB family transcription factor [Kiloniellales bacterium]